MDRYDWTEYADGDAYMEKSTLGEWVKADEAMAAIAALEADVARVSALAGIAIDGWQSWVDDQLQGTSHYDETIAEVNAARAALADQTAEGGK